MDCLFEKCTMGLRVTWGRVDIWSSVSANFALRLIQGSQVPRSKSWCIYCCHVSFLICCHVWRLGSWNLLITCNTLSDNPREEICFTGLPTSLLQYNFVNMYLYFTILTTSLSHCFRLHSHGTYSTNSKVSSTSVYILEVRKVALIVYGQALSYTLMFGL
jgi:hypothetical protein